MLSVTKGTCDFLWIPITISKEMTELMDYTAPVIQQPTVIFSYVLDTSAAGVTWSVIATNPMVVMLMFCMLAILAIIIFGIERKIYRVVSRATTLGQLIWDFYGTLFLEPLHYNFHTPSKMVIAVWWLSVVVVVSQLGGDLKANLAIKNKVAIDTVSDLLARPHIKPLIVDGFPYADLLKMSADKNIAAMYSRSVEMNGLIKGSAVLTLETKEMIMNGKAAFITPDNGAYLIMDFHCDRSVKSSYHISEKEVLPGLVPFPHRKGFPKEMRETIDRKFRQFTASGLTARDDTLARLRYGPCLWKPKKQKKGSDITFLVIIMASGMGISTLVLIIEIVIHKLTK